LFYDRETRRARSLNLSISFQFYDPSAKSPPIGIPLAPLLLSSSVRFQLFTESAPVCVLLHQFQFRAKLSCAFVWFCYLLAFSRGVYKFKKHKNRVKRREVAKIIIAVFGYVCDGRIDGECAWINLHFVIWAANHNSITTNPPVRQFLIFNYCSKLIQLINRSVRIPASHP
jgi:hypothetical protein